MATEEPQVKMIVLWKRPGIGDNLGPGSARNGAARRRFAATLFTVVMLAVAVRPESVMAQKGRFEVRSAASRLSEGVHLVTARIDYRLSDDALAALESGVTLTIQVQIEVIRRRNFRPDGVVATLKQDYELSYQPLSERFLVRNLNSGDQASFATLFSALNTMGRIVELPVIDDALLDPDGRYDIRLRAVLDQNTLPGPLRLIAFWSEGFRLESDWYTWQLTE